MSARYVLISPCRDEAAYMRETLESVLAQSLRPAKWVIVDDGSRDDTPRILAEYARRHGWIEIVSRQGQYGLVPDVDALGIVAVIDLAGIEAARKAVSGVRLSPENVAYVVDLVRATRQHPSLQFGASPRAA